MRSCYPIKYTCVPLDDYIGDLAEQGVSGEMQWLSRELFAVVLDGRSCHLVSGVEEAMNI
jgi:hypothetical protein